MLNPQFVAGEHGLFWGHKSEDIRTFLFWTRKMSKDMVGIESIFFFKEKIESITNTYISFSSLGLDIELIIWCIFLLLIRYMNTTF